jgi:hypothetical protein
VIGKNKLNELTLRSFWRAAKGKITYIKGYITEILRKTKNDETMMTWNWFQLICDGADATILVTTQHFRPVLWGYLLKRQNNGWLVGTRNLVTPVCKWIHFATKLGQ